MRQRPDLTSRRGKKGANLRALGRHLLDGTYHWYDRYCTWIQDLLYSSKAQVDRCDVIAGISTDQGTNNNQERASHLDDNRKELSPFLMLRAEAATDGSEKPSQHGCDPSRVRLFYGGPMCSRDREVPRWEYGTGYNTWRNQFWRVLTNMT